MADRQPNRRPQRWDVPFYAERQPDGGDGWRMDAAAVDRVLRLPPFCDFQADRFPRQTPLRGILQNDTRILHCRDGELIIREGDWGNSAFFILSGAVRVVLEPPGKGLPPEVLGRRTSQRKGLFRALAQLWRNHPLPEFRAAPDQSGGVRTGPTRGRATRVFLQDVPALLKRYDTARLEANLSSGTFFGELAAMGRIPRTATVFAEGRAQLLEIRWQGLRDLMEHAPALGEHMDQVFRRTALQNFLRHTSVFAHLNEQDGNRLAKLAQFETYGEMDWYGSFKELVKKGTQSGLAQEPVIAEEGHHCNDLIIIRSGLARLSQRYNHGHRTIGYLTKDQVFGYDEIAEGWRTGLPVPLRFSLRAVGHVSVVTVAAPLVEAFLLDHPAANVKGGPPAVAVGSTAGGDRRINADFVEFLVEERFINGTAAMMIDLDRCTRCDDCVRACAAAHDNNPRFLRQGPIQNNIMIAAACLHCQDPVCMIECPTGAIHRELHGPEVVINEQTCIGCGACANNCPYDAIRMVEIRDEQGDFPTPGPPVRQATKCDLCVDQLGGPACQRACPHDALVRMDMTNASALSTWLDR